MTTTEVSVVRATPRDVGRVCNLFTEAYFNLQPTKHVLPDQGRRRALLPGLLRLTCIEPAMQYGSVYCTATRMGAVAWVCITPPDTDDSPIGLAEQQAREQRMRQEAVIRGIGLRDLVGELSTTVEQVIQLCEAAQPMDRGPFNWLLAVGVHPLFRNDGFGSGLLNVFHNHLDAGQRGAYTQVVDDDRLIGFLQRFGYQPIVDDGVRREIVFPTGARLVAMWRDPRPVAPDPPPRRGSGAGAARIHRSPIGYWAT